MKTSNNNDKHSFLYKTRELQSNVDKYLVDLMDRGREIQNKIETRFKNRIILKRERYKRWLEKNESTLPPIKKLLRIRNCLMIITGLIWSVSNIQIIFYTSTVGHGGIVDALFFGVNSICILPLCMAWFIDMALYKRCPERTEIFLFPVY